MTVVAPKTRVDLALPEDIPLADLVPTILRYAGEDLADTGAEHGGWSLARLGAAPLDTSRTCGQLEIRDGEQLHFRPHTAAAPEAVFDDVVEAIATSSRSRRRRWAPELSRAVSLSVAVVAAVLGALVCAVSGLAGGLAAVGLAALLLVAGLILSRALADARTGALVAAAALPYAFVGGLRLLAGDAAVADLAAPHLLVGLVLTAVAAVLAALAVAEGVHLFLATAIAAGVGALGALLPTVTPATGPGAAGVVAALALAVTPLLPMLSFRLARLPMPAVPTGPEDLKSDVESVAGREVLALSEQADRHLAGLLLATGAVTVFAQLTLVLAGELGAAWLCLVVALALMLRARVFVHAPQRLPLLVAGLTGAGLLALEAAAAAGTVGRLTGLLGTLLATVVGALVYGLTVPGRRVSPYWGRALDIMEFLAVVAVVPLTLLVLGALGAMLGLGG
ncbi:MAG TPA: type VII secretion integral membrane protein EccD [Mycobacteriales bacterium]|nr:type VII secretion integral membrane protein EccD [Mycobacteriales bacterium]